MRITLLLLLGCLYRSTGASQEILPIIPRFTVKTNVFPIIQPFKRAAILAGELRLSRHWATELSLGYFFESTTFASRVNEYYRGPRLRYNIKFYSSLDPNSAIYVGLEAKYQQIAHRYFELYERQGGQYFEELAINRSVNTTGLAFKSGIQFQIGKRKRFIFEYFLGLGGVIHDVRINNLPADATGGVSERRFIDFRYDTGRNKRLDLLSGVQIGYLLSQ
jgi:hypothetical protein